MRSRKLLELWESLGALASIFLFHVEETAAEIGKESCSKSCGGSQP